MRAIGVDLGSRRIGIAVSNTEGTVAVPYEVLHRGKNRNADHGAIMAIVEETGAEIIVVGMPYSLDGSVGPAAKKISAEIDQIRRVSPVDVTTIDERFTTVTADRSLREMSLGANERRRMVDAVAASVMLQAWLDGERVDNEGRQ